MRRLFVIIIVALLCGTASFFFTRSKQASASNDILLDQLPELAWLQTELKLTDAEYEKVKALHQSYRPKCEELCHRVHTSHQAAVELATKSRKIDPALAAAIAEHARVTADCQKAMLEHIYETASSLTPDKAKVYLERVLPHALQDGIKPHQ